MNACQTVAQAIRRQGAGVCQMSLAANRSLAVSEACLLLAVQAELGEPEAWPESRNAARHTWGRCAGRDADLDAPTLHCRGGVSDAATRTRQRQRAML